MLAILTSSRRCSAALQGVIELRILSVSQVQELLVFQLHIARLSSGLGLLPVLPPAIAVDEKHVHEANNLISVSTARVLMFVRSTYPADYDGDLSRNIAGSVFRSESLRAYYITHAVADKVQCCHCRLLGVSSLVRSSIKSACVSEKHYIPQHSPHWWR